MFWFAFIATGIIVALYIRRKQVQNAIIIAHYEAIYWILGGAATLDHMLHSSRNNHGVLPTRSGNVAVVTGGSRGIGLEVVKKLLDCDMHVVIGCRKVQAGINAIERLRNGGCSNGTSDVIELDTSSLKSVRRFASELLSRVTQLHLLINNAGIMFVPFSLTEDGFESHMGVNYMGHALLTHLLLPLLKETGRNADHCSRIIHVSSCAHLAGSIQFDDINYAKTLYIPSEAYAQSKLAQIMFSNALNRTLKEERARVLSVSVHPGVVNTELFDGTLLKRLAPWAPKLFFMTPEEGSRSIVFAALSDTLEEGGGVYISNCQKTRMSSIAQDICQQEKLMLRTQDMLKVPEFCGVGK